MSTNVLSPEDHEQFIKDGYVILKNLVPLATVEAAVRQLEKNEELTEDSGHFISHSNDLIEACITDSVLDALQELHGDSHQTSRSRANWGGYPRKYTPDKDDGSDVVDLGVHIDENYPCILPDCCSTKVVIALSRVSPRGGAYIYAPGSPLRFLALMIASPGIMNEAAGDVAHSGPCMEFLAEPGDVMLAHSHIAHAGSINVSSPTTRHMLLLSKGVDERIAPGKKPFAEMSTMEKANSARYLQNRFGVQFQTPALEDDDTLANVLSNGFTPAGGIKAHAIIRLDGRNHLFYADRSGTPGIIHHVHSNNWAEWEVDESIDVGSRMIESLSVHQNGYACYLLAVTESDGGSVLTVRSSLDLKTWRHVGDRHGVRGALAHTNSGTASQVAIGKVVFSVRDENPNLIEVAWGETWDGVADWTDKAVACRAPGGHVIDDFTMRSLWCEFAFAMVMDVRDPEIPSPSSPMILRSSDGGSFEDSPQPLAYDMPTTPHQIRVFICAKNYWLVSYLRQISDEDRLFWGIIDWIEEPTKLQELQTPDRLEEALYTVGLL